jgi:hypothetical protein
MLLHYLSSNGGNKHSVIITRRTKSYSSPGNVLFGTVTCSRNVNVRLLLLHSVAVAAAVAVLVLV